MYAYMHACMYVCMHVCMYVHFLHSPQCRTISSDSNTAPQPCSVNSPLTATQMTPELSHDTLGVTRTRQSTPCPTPRLSPRLTAAAAALPPSGAESREGTKTLPPSASPAPVTIGAVGDAGLRSEGRRRRRGAVNKAAKTHRQRPTGVAAGERYRRAPGIFVERLHHASPFVSAESSISHDDPEDMSKKIEFKRDRFDTRNKRKYK